MNRRMEHFLLAGLMVLTVALAACHHEAKPAERYYALNGTVVSVDKGHKQVIVDHKAIPGFMPAMTMSYTVMDDPALNQLEAGDRITARVVVTTDNNMWLDNIIIHKEGEPSQPQPGAERRLPANRQEAP